MSPAILTRVRVEIQEYTARNEKKEDVANHSSDTMLEDIYDVQDKENPVYDDEDQLDFTFCIPNHHIASNCCQKEWPWDSEVVRSSP